MVFTYLTENVFTYAYPYLTIIFKVTLVNNSFNLHISISVFLYITLSQQNIMVESVRILFFCVNYAIITMQWFLYDVFLLVVCTRTHHTHNIT